MRKSLMLLLLMLAPALRAQGQEAARILDESIAYHGMNDWYGQAHSFTLRGVRPDGSESTTIVHLGGDGAFGMEMEREGRQIAARMQGEECAATMDDDAPMPDSLGAYTDR